MSTPRSAAIANAVVNAINTATLSTPVVARFAWKPELDRKDLDVLACWVVPDTIEGAVESRESFKDECVIIVCLHQSAESEQDLTALAALLEQVSDELRLQNRVLTTSRGSALCTASRIGPQVDAEAWETRRQYMGVARLTYRIDSKLGGGA